MAIRLAKDDVPLGTPIKSHNHANHAQSAGAPELKSQPDLFRGIGNKPLTGPTLRSIRRKKNLQAALREINRRPVGIDGVPYWAFKNPREYGRWNPGFLCEYGLEPLKYIQKDIEFGYGYTPSPTRTIKIKGRTVVIGTVANRIIERAASRKLSANLDKDFSAKNYGFRPGKSTKTAILAVRQALRSGFHWALKADIEDFFPSVNRVILEAQLRAALSDSDLCALIMNIISPAVGRSRGLPLGNGVSPILSNIYVHHLDLACGHLHFFRYVDDVLVLGESFQELLVARNLLEGRLAQLHLRLNADKTDYYDLHKKPLIFLGYEIRGGNLYPSPKAILKLERKLRFRGQEAQEKINLMRSFAARYDVGPVRKLFRRIDRELHRHYPAGWTLVGIVDHPASVRERVGSSNEQFAGPKGKAAGMTAKKAEVGQTPVAAAAGEQGSVSETCSLAPME